MRIIKVRGPLSDKFQLYLLERFRHDQRLAFRSKLSKSQSTSHATVSESRRSWSRYPNFLLVFVFSFLHRVSTMIEYRTYASILDRTMISFFHCFLLFFLLVLLPSVSRTFLSCLVIKCNIFHHAGRRLRVVIIPSSRLSFRMDHDDDRESDDDDYVSNESSAD